MFKDDYSKVIGELFKLLKDRPSLDLGSNFSVKYYFDLIVEYENLRKEIVEKYAYGINSLEDNIFLKQTGLALSNLSWDIKKSYDSVYSDKLSFESSNKIMFLSHRGGVCNRLRAIASLDVVREIVDCGFNYSWTENNDCGGAPVWAIDHSNTSVIGSQGLSEFLKELVSRDMRVLLLNDPISHGGFFKLLESCIDITWKEFDQRYRLKAKHLFQDIVIGSQVGNEIEKYHAVLSHEQEDGYLALHVRRTDMIEHFRMLYPNKKFPEVEDYFEVVEEVSNGRKFFLSTDCSSVLESFSAKYKHLVINVDGEFSDSFRQTSYKHTLIDLGLLSKAKHLAITPASSFSSFASTIGDIKGIDVSK